MRRFLFGVILFISSFFLLTSCLEVKEAIDINKDGSGNARLEIAVKQELAGAVIPELKKNIPKGWNIVEEKVKEGKNFIVFSSNFKDISELNDDEINYSFSSKGKSFLKKDYTLEVKQIKSYDMPFPYEVTIKMPGSITETDGTKISSNEVRWNLVGLNRGTKLVVKSSALLLPGAVIYIAAAIAGVILIFTITKISKRVKTSVFDTSVPSKTIFCVQCGKENPASAIFCTNCGEKL